MELPTHDVKEKIVAVTGGAGGLGLAMLNSFLKHGVKLAICLDINETEGQENVAALNQQYGDRAVFYKCNVSTDLDLVYEKIIRNHQKVDILINNAGISNEKNIRAITETNVLAVLEWSIKFYDLMRKDKGGSGGTIINISSILGFRVLPYAPIYTATKFAVKGFSKSLGHKTNFERTGVRIVCLCPGFTHTKLGEKTVLFEEGTMSQLLSAGDELGWQEPDVVGESAVELYQKADTGTVWLVECSQISKMFEST